MYYACMNRALPFLILACCSAFAQEVATTKIAVVGLVHAHVWEHLRTMVSGTSATLVGVAEPIEELREQAGKLGVRNELLFTDYKQMLDQTKPDIVWAFVENNRHLEIAEVCAPRHINLIYEKPLASNYPDARKIADLAKKYNVQVMTNYQMAWWPSNYTAKAAVDRGDVGTVYRLHGVVGHGGPGSEGVMNKYFFAWLTDPVKNGAGALMDFGCYNVLWSLWYMGMPTSVYASVDHLRPERFPKVEDAATLVLNYPNGVGIFEGSWNLPRSFQDLEVFGRPDPNGKAPGSIYVSHAGVQLKQGKETKDVTVDPLPADEAEPVAYMISRLRTKQPVTGLTAVDINTQVIQLIDLAKESVTTGRAVSVPKT